ncbi:putative eukaryotic translation initiation factor 4E-3 [Elsinoe australis]|uniref:Eukaryotic translation initiation factor 4E-1 n=1 Tax=Elsinoe australis TaxID=40998 RepID=A0A2P7ZQ91_9PEZI|nr:Eukaryotic translation initiation factor 4E-1 [Elsinoe australis]TKX21113.1 putative eukaryotic translation initiation factor 4E-3 [Elsinoe australis]
MAEVASMPKSPVPLDTIPISPDGDNAADSTNGTSSGETVTVFHDPENFNVKHPLLHEWTLWFTKPPSGKQDWNELLKEVISFNSVEEFWGIYNNITPASDLAPKSDYHLFKKGVRPEWEDPQNRHGGRWAYTFKEKKPNDDIWLNVLLAAIGEQLEDEEDNEVMGVVVNLRKSFYRICLWTRTAGKGGSSSKNVLEKIGKRFKDVLTIKESEAVEFMGHQDSANSGSSRARAKFSV